MLSFLAYASSLALTCSSPSPVSFPAQRGFGFFAAYRGWRRRGHQVVRAA
jgi:hypothetical protein